MKILVMDFGTSSIKFSILDETFEIQKTIKIPYELRIYNGDWAELDGDILLNAMIQGIRNLGDQLDEIELIGFDNFSPSLIFMDMEGNPLCPLFAHLDRRSKKQTQNILDDMGKEKFQSITGILPFTGGASITSVLWVKENMEEVFKKAFHIGHLNTFIYKKLTGMWLIDPVNASMTGIYETITRQGWSKEICKTFGIPLSLLPEIKEAGTIAGNLRNDVAALCGLKAGIPVALGSNDAATAQIGAQNTKSGDILNISGSSEMISILTELPYINDLYYLRCAATPELWQIYATTTGGFAIDWFRKEFYRDMDERTFFNREFPRVINEYLDKTSVTFLPYLMGDRQSITPKKAAFKEITLETKREDLLAAIVLGIHDPIKKVIETTESFLKLGKTIKVTGGMIDGSILRAKEKLFAKYLFKFVPDCPVIGSAILAMNGLNSI